jgi:hypothetical protein
MKSASRIAVAVALSFSSLTLVQAQAADADARQVVALADAGAVRWSAVDVPLESYAGRYVAEDGHLFSITIGDDALTFEAREGSVVHITTLRALDATRFESLDGATRVTFTFDADGTVSGASVSSFGRDSIATAREPLRGVVTIVDPNDEAATDGLLRRGVVTIYDVVDLVASGVAAN